MELIQGSVKGCVGLDIPHPPSKKQQVHELFFSKPLKGRAPHPSLAKLCVRHSMLYVFFL